MERLFVDPDRPRWRPLLAIDLIHVWRLCETDGARLRRGCLSFVQGPGRDLSIVSS
jgi:hypothetical protein